MFTSRVEFRLIVLEDNADRRLSHYGHEFGLLNQEAYDRVMRKYDAIDKEIKQLKQTRIHPASVQGAQLNGLLQKLNSSPIRQVTSLSEILKRPEIRYAMIAAFDGKLQEFSSQVIAQVEYEIKYEGFIQRQKRDVQRFRHIENIRIPDGMEYAKIPGLSIEVQQKLKFFGPRTLGQALRISGITPAAISVLMVYLRKLSLQRKESATAE